MNALALPRFDPDSQHATRSAVASGMNGVTPELRDFALRKVRRSLRRGQLSPARAMRAMSRGDTGIARLFPVGSLPPVPTLAVESCAAASPCDPRLVKESLWFVEHALRRGIDTSGVLDRIADPRSSANEVASLLLDIWNRLLESYAPSWIEWTPATASNRPQLRALPLAFMPLDAHAQVTVEVEGISRLFVSSDRPDFAELRSALSYLGDALQFNLFAPEPVGMRSLYLDYSMGYELDQDIRHHLVWPEGAERPLITDLTALELLVEEHGYDDGAAEHLAERVIEQMVFERQMAVMPVHRKPESETARRIMRYADRLKAMPGKKKPLIDINGLGAPVTLFATYEGDGNYDDIAHAVDMECQEDVLSASFSDFANRASDLDNQLARLVAEMVVTEVVYAEVLESE